MEYLVEIEASKDGEEVVFTDFYLDSDFRDQLERSLEGKTFDHIVVYLSQDDQLVSLWEAKNLQGLSKAKEELAKYVKKGSKRENKTTDSYGGNSYGSVCELTA